MYNRYIPQPDGSYRRRPVQEARQNPQRQTPPPQKPTPPPPPPSEPPKHESPRNEPPRNEPPRNEPPRKNPQQTEHPLDCPRQESLAHIGPPRAEPVSGFLRQLIPKDFDTGDLIIVLLLLLIAGDDPPCRSNALLTLALYFMM